MKIICIILVILLPNMASAYDQRQYMEQQQQFQLLQQMQHTKPNPQKYLNSVKASSNEPVVLPLGSDGHYFAPVEVNGQSVDMMADTGASAIFLTQADAQKLGIQTSNLHYNKQYTVAGGGTIYAAETTVSNFKVGDIVLSDVPVSVSRDGTGNSLLGMDFFKKLSRYESKDGQLMLYK